MGLNIIIAICHAEAEIQTAPMTTQGAFFREGVTFRIYLKELHEYEHCFRV